jgi:hypothetical protein
MPEDSPYDFAEPNKPKPEPRVPAKKPQPVAKKPPLSDEIELKPADSAVPTTPRSSAIPDETPTRICPHCGYRMFGKLKARCPECAAPTDTVATDLLQFASTSWVRGVANGILLISPAIILHVVGASMTFMNKGSLPAILHTVAAVLMLGGVLLGTTKDPGVGGHASPGGTYAKAFAFAAMVLWVLLLLVGMNIIKNGHVDKTLTILVLLCYGGLAITLGFHFNVLCSQIPNDTLASHALNTGWLTAIACLMLVAIQSFDLSRQLNLFFCSFPMIGFFVAAFVWAAITVLRVSIDVRNAAIAGDAIAAKRAAREAAAAAKK